MSDRRPSFADMNAAYRAISYIPDEVEPEYRPSDPIYFAAGKPVLSGRTFTTKEAAYEDGRILAALTAPDLTEGMKQELMSLRPEAERSAPFPATVKSNFEKAEGSLAAYAIENEQTPSSAAAHLVMTGTLPPNHPSVLNADSGRKSSRSDIRETIVNIRSDLPRGAPDSQMTVIGLTAAHKTYADDTTISPAGHAAAFKRIEKAAMMTDRPERHLRDVFSGVAVVQGEMARSQSRGRDTGNSR